MLRKPKAPPLPKPFTDISASSDDSARMRALKMKMLHDRDPGFSWNQPQETAWERFRANPLGFALRMAGALGMTAFVVGIFYFFTSQGFTIPLRIIYAESWGAERTSEDALADRQALLAKVERYLEAERQKEADAAARQRKALATDKGEAAPEKPVVAEVQPSRAEAEQARQQQAQQKEQAAARAAVY